MWIGRLSEWDELGELVIFSDGPKCLQSHWNCIFFLLLILWWIFWKELLISTCGGVVSEDTIDAKFVQGCKLQIRILQLNVNVGGTLQMKIHLLKVKCHVLGIMVPQGVDVHLYVLQMQSYTAYGAPGRPSVPVQILTLDAPGGPTSATFPLSFSPVQLFPFSPPSISSS